MRIFFLAGILGAVLAVPNSALAQAGLTIEVTQGQGATNDIGAGAAAPIEVVVRDSSGQPASKALVTFAAPAIGPGVLFFGGSRKISITTDEAGRAAVGGLSTSADEGPFIIGVEAAHGGARATAEIAQTNVSSEPKPKRKRSFGPRIITGIALAVAGVIVAIAR